MNFVPINSINKLLHNNPHKVIVSVYGNAVINSVYEVKDCVWYNYQVERFSKK